MGSRTMGAVLALAFALTCGPIGAAPALAKPDAKKGSPKAGAAAPVEGQLSLEEIAVMLSSTNGDEVRMAIEGSASLGSPDVIPMIAERVNAGLPADLLEIAMDSLVMVGDASAGDVFSALASHRRPAVRLRAVQGLLALHAKDAERVLIAALGDSSPPVREAAAQGLGDMNAVASLDTLFVAFDHGVGSAARAIGRLANDNHLPRLVAYLGKVPLTSLTPIFDAVLSRREISEPAKLQLVSQLAELGTAETRGYLEGLAQKLPADTSTRVRRAIDDAVARIAQ